MNAFLSTLDKHDLKRDILRREKLTTLQVNTGNLCNQYCLHCHIEASPKGKDIMSEEVIINILQFLLRYKIKTLDLTGGAPELNPHFDYLVESCHSLVDELIVRSNLTVFLEAGKAYLAKFLKDNNAHLICSLPCYTKENVDSQRGEGVFEKSIEALRLLNALGFAKGGRLDLVYNPQGAYLPPQQSALEKEYKQALRNIYGIEFNRLLSITNVPIKRFKDYLESNGEYEKYFSQLEDNFNPLTLDNLMCRTFLSVGFDGRLYDCDFNLALGLSLRDQKGKFLSIDTLHPQDLEGKEIIVGEHCLSCTAGCGSSCQGELVQDKKEIVKVYYGKILKEKSDLKTNVCCESDSLTSQHKDMLKKIEPEILNKFYGCGSPLPPLLKACRVLDLGCGTGRDAYLASYLVQEEGFVIGIDMTDEQLEIATKYRLIQMQRFGIQTCNVDFKKGYIEDLKAVGIKDNSIDVVISNCVINLSVDKQQVFSEIFRVLKPGGELYFSDIFSGRRVPKHLKEDPVLYGECLGGALYLEDFRRILKKIGCLDYRVVSSRRINLNEPEIQEKIAAIDFYSLTIRAFKLDDLEDICEDYGQIATYLGNMPDNSHRFKLDDHHVFIAKKPVPVCGNTASMLMHTRYSEYFKVTGDRTTHFGPFNCAAPSNDIKKGTSNGGACC